jgi:hypothetical protein
MCHVEAVVGIHLAESLHTVLHYWAAGLHSINPRISETQKSTYFFMNMLFNSGLKSTHFVECYCSSFDTEKCHMTCVSLQFLYDLSLDLSGEKKQ